MQAMIFAAGKGTRLKPLTDSIPKALVEVKGKTLLARTIESLKAAGCERIVVNVHHFSEQIKDYLARHDFGIDIRISDETSRLLDTGGGIKSAAALLDVTRPVLIHNVDILSNVDLQDFYNYSTGADVRMLVSRRKTKRYLIFNTNMRLVGWTNIETSEIKSPYPTLRQLKFEAPDKVGYLQHNHYLLAFSGIHVVGPELFNYLRAERENVFPIMIFYLRYAERLNILGYEKPDLKILDVGKLDTLRQAEQFVDEEL